MGPSSCKSSTDDGGALEKAFNPIIFSVRVHLRKAYTYMVKRKLKLAGENCFQLAQCVDLPLLLREGLRRQG